MLRTVTLALVLSLIVLGARSETSVPSPLTAASDVRVFLYNPEAGPAHWPFTLGTSVAPRSGRRLTPAQVEKFRHALIDGMPGPAAMCTPVFRHAFVAYDRNGEITNFILLCFECGDVRLVGPLAEYARNYVVHWGKMRALVKELGLPIEPEHSDYVAAAQ